MLQRARDLLGPGAADQVPRHLEGVTLQGDADPVRAGFQGSEGEEVVLKLYVLIPGHLPIAAQAVQAGHAIAQFGVEHPYEFSQWQADSNTLIYLNIDNVERWETILEDGEFLYSTFTEPEAGCLGPNWNTEWYPEGVKTAIAVAPNWYAQYLLFDELPLAFTGALTATQAKNKADKAAWYERQKLERKPEPKKRWWQ
jgi:hypothetical protein